MQVKYEELQNRLNKKIVDHLYLFLGEEKYLIEETIQRIKKASLSPEEQEENFHLLYGDEFEWDIFLSLAYTRPFIGKKRLIVLRGLDKVKVDNSRLVDLLKKKHPYVFFIFVTEKIDLRTKLGKTFTEKAMVTHFYQLFENQVPPWIVQKVKKSAKNISFPLAQIIAQMVGNNLSRIESELTKIFLYMGDEEEITQDHLVVVSGETRIFSVFDLMKYLGQKQKEASLKTLSKLLEEGVFPLVLLSMVVRQFRQIYLAKSFIQKGKKTPEIARSLGIPMMFVGQITEQAKMYSYNQLQLFFEQLLEIDRKLKSSSCPPRLILENLVIQICNS